MIPYDITIEVIVNEIKDRILNGDKNVPIYGYPKKRLDVSSERIKKFILKNLIKKELGDKADEIEIIIHFLYRQ